MSITSAQGAQFAAGLGVERIVVGRELSIKEIAKVGVWCMQFWKLLSHMRMRLHACNDDTFVRE